MSKHMCSDESGIFVVVVVAQRLMYAIVTNKPSNLILSPLRSHLLLLDAQNILKIVSTQNSHKY